MFSIPCKQQCLCVQLQLALSSEQLVSTELRPEGLLRGGRTVVETPHSFPGCWGVSLWNKQTRCWLLNTTSIHAFFQTPASSLSLLWQPAAGQRNQSSSIRFGSCQTHWYTGYPELILSAPTLGWGRVSLLPSHVPSSSWCQEPTCFAKGFPELSLSPTNLD